MQREIICNVKQCPLGCVRDSPNCCYNAEMGICNGARAEAQQGREGEIVEGICDRCGRKVRHFAGRKPGKTWLLCRNCVNKDCVRKDIEHRNKNGGSK